MCTIWPIIYCYNYIMMWLCYVYVVYCVVTEMGFV